MRELRNPDLHHLLAAVGWLGLKNWVEANEELDKITPTLRTHPDVLRVRLEIYLMAEKWDVSAELAQTLCNARPKDAQIWISLAYVKRRQKEERGGVSEAREVLLQASERFPKNALIAYNLARCESKLGD